MKFSYEDLLSGDSIPVSGVGHIRSPRLRELKPTQGIGTWTYNLYLNMLAWDKAEFINFMKATSAKRLKALEKDTKLGVFDTVTLQEFTRKIMQTALSFFMDETLEWDEKARVFIAKNKDGQVVGNINRDNFEDVRDMMLQVNYINIGKNAKPVKYASGKAKSLWEKAQKNLKEQAKSSKRDRRTSLGNILSKLCCAGVGYTFLNVYDLTIYQLYDQFFQYGYLRATSLSERAFTIHGGEKFDAQGWLKPLN